MSPTSSSHLAILPRSFLSHIGVVLSLVLAVALLGLTIGYGALHRVSGNPGTIVYDVMLTERLTAGLRLVTGRFIVPGRALTQC